MIDESLKKKYDVKPISITYSMDLEDEFVYAHQVRNMFETLDTYMNELETSSFVGWDGHAKNGYLTSLMSMKEFISGFKPNNI